MSELQEHALFAKAFRTIDPTAPDGVIDMAWGISPGAMWRAARKEMTVAPAAPKWEDVAAILNGIDETETESKAGWWETSIGAAFGDDRITKLKALFGEKA